MKLVSTPEYTKEHSGPVFVVGGGSCVGQDLDAARAMRGHDVPIIAVNRTVLMVDAFAVVSAHPDLCFSRHDVPAGVTVHEYPSDQRNDKPKWARSDYIWRGPHLSIGTSSLCAMMIAKALGFTEVIACGVPLLPIGYAKEFPAPKGELDGTADPGDVRESLSMRRGAWGEYHAAGHMAGCFSMSGATNQILGFPPTELGA